MGPFGGGKAVAGAEDEDVVAAVEAEAEVGTVAPDVADVGDEGGLEAGGGGEGAGEKFVGDGVGGEDVN